MAHNTSGLPPLDLEPFDPSALYAAARSPERQKDLATSRATGRRRAVGIVLAVGLALASVVAGTLAFL